MDIVGIEPTTFRTHKTMRSERYTPKLNAQSTGVPSQKDTIWNTGIYSLLYKRLRLMAGQIDSELVLDIILN